MEEEADLDCLLPKQPLELIAELVHFASLRQKCVGPNRQHQYDCSMLTILCQSTDEGERD